MRSMKWRLPCCALAAGCLAALTPVAALADPVISGFNSPQVPLLSYLIIYGSGFGDAQGLSYVTMASRPVPVQSWSDGAIHVYVNPMAFVPGPVALDAVYPVQVVIPSAGKSSNVMNVTITAGAPPGYTPVFIPQVVTDQPTVTGLQATRFTPGSNIAIYGSGFGVAEGSSYLSVTVPFRDAQGHPFTQEYQIPVLAWSENAINAVLLLPAGAQLGTYTLTVHRSNGKTASATFTVVATL